MATVALATMQVILIMAELAKKVDVQSNEITDWKKQQLNNVSDVFGKYVKKAGVVAPLSTGQFSWSLFNGNTLRNSPRYPGSPPAFHGSRRIRDWLESQGHRVSRKNEHRLMRKMGLATRSPKRDLSAPNRSHKVYPYWLKGLVIDWPNQVWATDITYIPMSRGFVYLVAILD